MSVRERKATENLGLGEKEILIEGKIYDVDGFRHPGGSIIKFYAGKELDASQAFANFHIRSTKARKLLATLPSRPAPALTIQRVNNQQPGQASLLADFDALMNDLKTEGFFEPAPLHVAYRLSEIVLLHVLGMYLLLNGSMYLGLIVLGIVQGRCGWLMHEGGHYSLTGNIQIDRQIQIWVYGVGCGMSGGWWRNQHNKHHSMPQKLGHDVDLETLPLVAFTEKIAKKVGIPMKLWLRLQGYLFPVITTLLVALGWQFFLHPRYMLRTKKTLEMVALAVRFALWTYFVTGTFGLSTSIAMYMMYNWVGSTYIFLNFAVSHTHLPTVDKDDSSVDWIRYSANHTMNVDSGPFKFVDWWMSFLNFQIEHHLFPSMPQFRHPTVSPRVRALFAKHGLKYDSRDYITAMKDTFANLHNVGHDVFYG
jgi:fatty acid desaturase